MNVIRDDDDRFADFLRRSAGEGSLSANEVPRDAMWAAIAVQRPGNSYSSTSSASAGSSIGTQGTARRVTPVIPLYGHQIIEPTKTGRCWKHLSDIGAPEWRESCLWPSSYDDSNAVGDAAAAALLVGGVLIGVPVGRQYTASQIAQGIPAAGANAVATLPSGAAYPVQVATSEHFRETEQMLATFASNERSGRENASADARIASWARNLLKTTVDLQYSKAADDPQRARLLHDLELVLVQITQLSPTPEDRELVGQAIKSTGMIERLKTATVPGQSGA